MCSLLLANATIALEAKLYEQASNAPLSFCRVGDCATIVCRLSETGGKVIANYTGTMNTRSEPIQTKYSGEILDTTDITKAERFIFEAFAARLQSLPVSLSARA